MLRTSAGAALALACTLLCACGGSIAPMPIPEPATNPGSAQNDILPRLQWMFNYGYCGETSIISAGLYYGQYLSQYDARSIANPGVPQYLKSSQLLLTQNAAAAAKQMHLVALTWNSTDRSSPNFLAWVKRNVERGYPVAIGVYTNEYYFYSKRNPHAGDPSYDHIVPVVAVGADALTFSDNGLNDPSAGPIGPHPGHWRPLRKYLYAYAFNSFPKTREQANAPHAPPYSLALAGPRPAPADYGIAIAGVIDPAGETLPVRLATNKYYEWPPIKRRSNVRPRPESLTLTVTVSKLKRGVGYTLYRYDGFASVPDRDFNHHASSASSHWTFTLQSGDSYTMTQTIESDQTVIYRAVPASGP